MCFVRSLNCGHLVIMWFCVSSSVMHHLRPHLHFWSLWFFFKLLLVFTMERTRKTKQRRGGIGFLIRNDIANIIEECERNTDPKSETKWIRLKTKQPICIAVTYGLQKKCTNRKGRGTISRTNHRHKHL